MDHTTLNCSTTADTSTGTMISLSAACPFPVDRLYRVQVWAFGCYKHLVGNSVLLSTHRVQITSIQPLRMGGVQIIGKFLNNSETTGFLAVFYSATDKDVVYYYPVFKPPNQLKFKHVFGDHLSGRFAISIFVIDENSLPLSRAISTPRIVKVKAAQDPGEYEGFCVGTRGKGGQLKLELSTAHTCLESVQR